MQTQSAVKVDLFDDGELPRYDISMSEAISDSDEFLNDIESKGEFFAIPHDIELEINKSSLDEVVEEASNDLSSSSIANCERGDV